jgi:hypothetical protein
MGAEKRDDREKHCPMESQCPMYDLFQLSGTQGLWQAFYCHHEFERCARLQISNRGQTVPLTLLPDGKLLRSSRRPPPE